MDKDVDYFRTHLTEFREEEFLSEAKVARKTKSRHRVVSEQKSDCGNCGYGMNGLCDPYCVHNKTK